MSYGSPSDGIRPFQALPEYGLELAVLDGSLAEIRAALQPVYEELEARCLGHSALAGVEAKEVRFTQAEADIAMMTSFGRFLPQQTQMGKYYGTEGSYVSKDAAVFSPSLTAAKLVQSFGVKLDSGSYSEESSTYAYVVGRRDSSKKRSELLLVTPTSHGQYEDRESGELGVIELPPRILSVVIHSRSADAMQEFADTQPGVDFTDVQVDAMRVYGKGVYRLPTIGVPGLRIKDGMYLTGSLRSGKLPQIERNGIRCKNDQKPVEPMDLVEHGIGEYGVLSRMANLAVAFGFTPELKSLLQQRKVSLEAAAGSATET